MPDRWQRFKAFYRYTIEKMGRWKYAYLIVFAMFWAFARPWYLAAGTQLVVTLWIYWGSRMQYNGRN